MIFGALADIYDDVEIGAAYRRPNAGPLVETAYVLSIAPDRMGIPHVCFDLEASRGISKPFVERRTLGLEAFRTQFCEKVQE